MREILFKAKRKDNNEWVYGYLQKQFVENEEYYITNPCNEFVNSCHVIIPETVSQYTGLKDKNGNKIFENDILCRNDKRYGEEKGQVIYEEGIPTIKYKNVYIPINHTCIEEWEIIGNIFDEEVK